MNDNPTFAEWRAYRVERYVYLVLNLPEEHRDEHLAGYMRLQAKTLVDEALMLGRAGLQDDDLMPFP